MAIWAGVLSRYTSGNDFTILNNATTDTRPKSNRAIELRMKYPNVYILALGWP